MKANVLKPGILVSLHTRIAGGVAYAREDLEREHVTEEGQARARWETTKLVDDPDEYEKATKVRGRASSLVRLVCAATAFGLLCAESREEELDAAMVEARSLCDEFNATAKTVRVHVYVIKGRIAATDEEATEAVKSEVEGLLGEMEAGIRGGNAKQIRDAANRARQVGAVLDEAAADKVTATVEAARRAAREITKRVEKEGEEAVLKSVQKELAVVSAMRFAFLDTSDDKPLAKGDAAMPAVDGRRFSELDVG